MSPPRLSPEDAKTIRLRFGLTQAEMDARLGMGKGSYRDFERGKRAVPGPTGLALTLLTLLREGGGVIKQSVWEGLWG